MKKLINITVCLSIGLFLIVISPAGLSAAALHAIIAADTLDRSIGASCIKDAIRMADEFRNISRLTGMTLRLKEFKGKGLLRSSILSYLKNLETGNDDAVIFYYSGHGYRIKEMNTMWPAMYLMGDGGDRKGLDELWVYKALESKKPRFLLVISDSCNNLIEGVDTTRSIRSARALPESYKKLFIEFQGGIIASGCKPGEYSYGNDKTGGLFSMAFLDTVNSAASTTDPDWEDIMKAAAKPINVYADKYQHPQYEIKKISGAEVVVNPMELSADTKDDEDIVMTYTNISGSTDAAGKEFRDKPPGKNYILTGLNIWHGEIIDAVQPIYSEISDNRLGAEVTGPKFGGNGGERRTVRRYGYIVNRIYVMEEEWNGRKVIGAMVVDFQKWSSNGPVYQSHYRSKTLGTKGKNWVVYELPPGGVITGIHGRSSQYLNRLSFIRRKYNP